MLGQVVLISISQETEETQETEAWHHLKDNTEQISALVNSLERFVELQIR